MIDIEKIAQICHEVNKVYCESDYDGSQCSWKDAPQWQKDSAINGVKFHLENDTTPEDSHKSWLKEKEDTGWKYGVIKNPYKKEHPCMVPYEELPKNQQVKDHLFKAIVDCFKTK